MGETAGKITLATPEKTEVLLAIDTATPFLVLGVLSEIVTVERSLPAGRAHAELLGPAVEALLAEVGCPTLIAVGSGPGSYTGLRVGASFALGLGKALDVPIVGVDTLQAIAAKKEGLVAAALDARRGQIYGGIYGVENGLIATTVLAAQKWSAEDFRQRAVGAQLLYDEAPSGLALARLAARKRETTLRVRYI